MARRHSSADDPPDAPSGQLAESVRAYHPKLIRFLLGRGANEADAKDIAQKVWLSLLKPGVNFLGTRFPKAYLWTAALREWARLNRRRQHEQQLVLVDSDAIEVQSEHPEHVDLDALSDDLIRNEEMAHAYASLSKEDKNVCNLMIEGMGAEEIAQATGLSRDRTERCMTRVRKRLEGLS
jgi:RNA polymerase sigma factor (sigma-70 family)